MKALLVRTSHENIINLLSAFDNGAIGTTALKQIISNHIAMLDNVKLRVIVYKWALNHVGATLSNIQVYPETQSVLITFGRNNSVLCLSPNVTTMSPPKHTARLNEILGELLPESLLVRS